jgi:hypothetical protein
VDVDLEVEMTADRAGITGLPHGANILPRPDPIAPIDGGGPDQVSVEVTAPLALAVDQQVVAVEDRVIADAQHATGGHGHEGRATGGDDVEALMGAATATRSAEFADGATRSVRPVDRKDVGVELGRAIASEDRRRECGEKDEGGKKRTLQWCSMTRSTMLYSFASSAVMK